jgi:hypothetical protein
MIWKRLLPVLVVHFIGLSVHAQTVAQSSPDEAPVLAFKLLIRSTQPTFAPGEPLKLEVACVSVPTIASPVWQERWNQACVNVKLKVEEARVGGYWGGVGLIAWLQNRLHLCLPAPGLSYKEDFHVDYTKPQWRPITVPMEVLIGLRGMVQINAEIDFEVDGKKDLEVATRRTSDLWTVVENSPFQKEAIEIMQARLKSEDFVPDYDLLVALTGMKARLDQPLEFEAEDRQPYTEYHPDLERASIAYYRSLLNSLVASSGNPRSARALAIREIVDSIAENDMCTLGTYGLSSREATELRSELIGR